MKRKFKERILISYLDESEILDIQDTNFWLMVDDTDLTVGYGLIHQHFSDYQRNLKDGLQQAFDLLTNPIKTTQFKKGNTIYKIQVEIQYPDEEPVLFGTTTTLFHPFWKESKTEINISDKIIDKKDIETEMTKILKK